MKSPLVLALVVLPHLGAAYLDPPPTTAAPDTIEDCSYWRIATETDTCASISKNAYITETQFSTYNPSVADNCNLIVGNSYCIERNWGIPEETPTPTASSSAPGATQTATPISPDALAACEAEAGNGYKQYCVRCASRCTIESSYSACFENTFWILNYYDSQCWQHGGNDCSNKAADIVCPRK
ncbi:LysM domain-containing protein [Stagonosporopsis vannaccii]|nr:LysM domain-containing protein [Stagonosporopsis vannaccii]